MRKLFIYFFINFQFRLVNNDLIEIDTKEYFSTTLSNLLKTTKNENMHEKVEMLRALDYDGKWDSDYGLALLSGKIPKRVINQHQDKNPRCKHNLNTHTIHVLNSILKFQMI